MDYKQFYKQLFQPVEDLIGPMDEKSIISIIGFDLGGPVNVSTVGRGREEYVTYVSCELADREEQAPAECGRYEVMMTCDDEEWVHRMLTRIAEMSLDCTFGHGHTIDVEQWVEPDCAVQGLVIEEFARVTFDGQSYGILRFHGVTRAELEFAMERGSEKLFKKLKSAGVYPRTSPRRTESVKLGHRLWGR